MRGGNGEGRGVTPGAWSLSQIYMLSPGGSIPHFPRMPEQLPTFLGAGCPNVNMMTTQSTKQGWEECRNSAWGGPLLTLVLRIRTVRPGKSFPGHGLQELSRLGCSG